MTNLRRLQQRRAGKRSRSRTSTDERTRIANAVLSAAAEWDKAADVFARMAEVAAALDKGDADRARELSEGLDIRSAADHIERGSAILRESVAPLVVGKG